MPELMEIETSPFYGTRLLAPSGRLSLVLRSYQICPLQTDRYIHTRAFRLDINVQNISPYHYCVHNNLNQRVM